MQKDIETIPICVDGFFVFGDFLFGSVFSVDAESAWIVSVEVGADDCDVGDEFRRCRDVLKVMSGLFRDPSEYSKLFGSI